METNGAANEGDSARQLPSKTASQKKKKKKN
jgi:hypothetical protein